MKRAKLLLSSLVILAIVGGALAFKTHNKFNSSYCILTTVGHPSGGACTSKIDLSKLATATPAVTYWYTIKSESPCPLTDCTITASFTRE